MERVFVRVPATTANLGSGFDAVGMALGVYNDFELELTKDESWTAEIAGEGADDLPGDETNLVLRSARFLFDRAGIAVKGLKAKISNRIPLARGLGSSATAIVAGLVGANALLNRVFCNDEILAMASLLEGHPDNVAPACLGGIVVSFENDGRLWTQRICPPAELHVALVVPRFHLSTAAARAALPRQVALEDAVFNVGRAAFLACALGKGSFDGLSFAMEDRLHQPYRQNLVPGMEEVFAAAKRAGALGVALSGAGPTVMALSLQNDSKLGEAMAGAFAAHGVPSDVIWTKPSSHGALSQFEEKG